MAAAVLLVAPVRPRGQNELEAARQLWAARPFSRYRLALESAARRVRTYHEAQGKPTYTVRSIITAGGERSGTERRRTITTPST